MFLGNYEHTIDNKGRMAVPSRFRGELGERMVLTRWVSKCLRLYPVAEFEKMSESISKLSESDPRGLVIKRLFYSEAAEVELDKQGRIMIPSRLRDVAGFNGDDAQVTVVGMNSYVELWSPENWNQMQQEVEENAESYAAQFASLGLI
ncbi:MAG TPA: division/cell wall cluster transcriptional repressor MraZ [Chloroflexia bacterium]|nr:division/cell wall cluster transcriptional repressor MraZ [Chloroflexia bacterium]